MPQGGAGRGRGVPALGGFRTLFLSVHHTCAARKLSETKTARKPWEKSRALVLPVLCEIFEVIGPGSPGYKELRKPRNLSEIRMPANGLTKQPRNKL